MTLPPTTEATLFTLRNTFKTCTNMTPNYDTNTTEWVIRRFKIRRCENKPKAQHVHETSKQAHVLSFLVTSPSLTLSSFPSPSHAPKIRSFATAKLLTLHIIICSFCEFRNELFPALYKCVYFRRASDLLFSILIPFYLQQNVYTYILIRIRWWWATFLSPCTHWLGRHCFRIHLIWFFVCC